MAYTILSESYGRRLPKITAEADSTEDLTALGTDYAEGSTCNVGGTEYTLDKVSGWIVPGSGGGGGSVINVPTTDDGHTTTLNMTFSDIKEAFESGSTLIISYTQTGSEWSRTIVTRVIGLDIMLNEDPEYPSTYTVYSTGDSGSMDSYVVTEEAGYPKNEYN